MFQLNPQTWYAMEIFGAEGSDQNPHVSPIFIMVVKPLKSGKGLLEIGFFHANYPEGVQSKQYTLRVVHRTPSYLALVRTDTEQHALVVVFALNKNWMQTHFPNVDCSEDVVGRLNRIYPVAC